MKPEELPVTPRVRKALSLARKLAASSNKNYVGAEHLLIGLLQLADGPAHKLLEEIDVCGYDLRNRLLEKYKSKLSITK